MKNKWKWLGSLMILLGVVFIFRNPIQHFLIEYKSNQIVSSLDSKATQENQTKETEYDFDAVEHLNASSIFGLSSSDAENAIGSISIPEVDMELPLFNGLSNNDLLTGAGTMKADQQMGAGNYALAGHNWRDQETLFSPLHRAEKGMTVYLTDLETTYAYEIEKVLMVDPSRIDLIEDTNDTLLTLVTCNHDGTERLIIQASLVSEESYES